MSNEIDWQRPLECSHGELRIGCNMYIDTSTHSSVKVVLEVRSSNSIEYYVTSKDGTPFNKLLGDGFKVRNKQTNRDKAIEVVRAHMDAYESAIPFQTIYENIIDDLIQIDLIVKD